MIFAENNIDEFKKTIKTKQVVCFGCGDYFKIFALDFGNDTNIAGVIDNNRAKQGLKVRVGNISTIVYSANDALESIDFCHTVLVITVFSFQEIAELLNNDPSFDNVTCYVYSMLKYNSLKAADFFRNSCDVPLIPPVIHYVWFGKGSLPATMQKCVDNWRVKCPEYEIIKWDENNYDIYKNEYTRRCYEEHKWEYLSDYARIDIISQIGGIYLDTDVEIIGNIDKLRYNKGFIATVFLGGINTGSGFGAIAKHQFFVGMLSDFQNQFQNEIVFNNNIGRETAFFSRYGYQLNNETQIIQDVNILPFNIMSPLIPDFRKQFINEATIGIHYYSDYLKTQMAPFKIV